MNFYRTFKNLTLAALTMTVMAACEGDVFNIDADPFKGKTYINMTNSPISSYLESEPDFTEYVKALRYSDTYNALNQSTTGVSFTAFAPTNEAMQEFYGRRNVSSLEELPQSYVRSFVLYHTLPDSITSDKFVTKKSVTNLVGDVLSVEIDSVNAGQATINGEGHVVEMGISAYNGKVYVMSKAMTPLVETVLDRIVDAGQSSIMVGAIKETGWDKSLSVIQDTTLIEGVQTITKHYFTVFNVTDATFAKAGINSLADLKSKLKARDERGLAEDSLLREYVSYHIIGNMLKRADLAGAEGQLRIWSASAKNQVFTIQEDTLATDDNLRYTINGAGESAQFVAANSDVLSRNGYVHELNAWLPIWEPEQATVVWDFADYADIKSI
ncbi:MAG: fasciclin domain-containing protein, partial [Prevotella sp.]|nr:fasciclin domain-containing protein [Prevotella sp.]